MRRIVKKTLFIVFMLALVGFFTLMFGGCTPQSVKKSGAFAEQAVKVAEVNASKTVTALQADPSEELQRLGKALEDSLVTPLREALAFFKPVMKMIGYPKDIDVYVPGDPGNEQLASRAMTEAKLATMLEDAFTKFAKNKLPEALGKHIPDPVADKVSWEGILAMIAAVVTGYGGTKLGGKGIIKMLNKKGKADV